MATYEQLKKEAWDFYSKIKPVLCPALQNEQVVFSRAGFNHLIQKGRSPRPKKDQVRRLHLLPHAIAVLENPDSQVIIRKEKSVIFWKLSKKIGEKMVRVVVRQRETGSKHFFSIMNN